MIAPLPHGRTAVRTRLRQLLDWVESTLRDADELKPDPKPSDAALTTRELLLPRDTGEPASLRARRQAADYLERRRQHLREDLQGR
jgi:hypothetical protein